MNSLVDAAAPPGRAFELDRMRARQHLPFLILFGFIGFFYLQHVGEIPYGLFSDEANLGVDADALLRTGQDSAGQFLPLFLKGFGYYQGALPAYLLAPFISLFGKSDFAVRLLPIVFLLFSVVVLYVFLVMVSHSIGFSAIATTAYALQPWTFHVSRINNNTEPLSTFFILLGITFYALAVKQNSKRRALFAGLFFGLSLYGYYAFRLTTLMLLALLVCSEIFFLRVNKRKYAALALTLLVVALMYVPQVILYVSNPASLKRLDEKKPAILNKPISESGAELLTNYPKYYSLDFLFEQSDTRILYAPILRHSVTDSPLLNPLLLFLLPFALLSLATKPERFGMAFLLWLFVYPFPDILTTQPGYPPYTFALYHLTLIVPFVVLAALKYLKSTLANRKLFYWLAGATLAVTLAFFLWFYFARYLTYPRVASGFWGWQSGPKAIIHYFDQHAKEFDTLYLGNDFNEPEIFFQFYSINGCTKCRFGGLSEHKYWEKQLFAVAAESFQKETHRFSTDKILTHETIFYPNGTAAFYLISIEQALISQPGDPCQYDELGRQPSLPKKPYC